MTRYIHPKSKGKTFATIYAAEHLYWVSPEFSDQHKLTFKFNLRNIGKYSDYLSECTESIQKTVQETFDCYMCGRNCSAVFDFQGKTYSKCSWNIFRFSDFSEKALENYIKLLELENQALQNK